MRDLSLVGDVNGDGLFDVGVVHKIASISGDDVRSIPYLILGNTEWTGGTTITPELPGTARFWREENGVHGSVYIGNVGDLDDDGHAEFAFSADLYKVPDVEQEHRGVLFIVHGAPGFAHSGEFRDIGVTIPGTAIYNGTEPGLGITPGARAFTVADLNGDGRRDLALAAQLGDGGLVHVVLDARDLPPRFDLEELGRSVPGFTLRARPRPRGFVEACVDGGDIDGDGFHDLLIAQGGLGASGFIYVFYGRAEPAGSYELFELSEAGDGVLCLTPPVPQDDRYAIFAGEDQVAGIGDLNGDGFDEIAVGESYFSLNELGWPRAYGKVHIIYGGARLPSPIALDEIPPERRRVIHGLDEGFQRDRFGAEVGSAGDVNGDGLEDLLIGATHTSELWDRTGAAYLIYGQAEFPEDIYIADGFEGMRLVAHNPLGGLGKYPGPAGDFNGDGNADFLIGEPQLLPHGNGARAYVVFGTGGGEAPLTVVSMDRTWGFLRGGDAVRIRGTGFLEGTAVRFGERAARRVERVSATELLVETPRGESPGEVEVRVSVRGTTRTAPQLFTYVPDRPEVDLRAPGRWGLRLDGVVDLIAGLSVDYADLDGDGVDDLLIASDVIADWLVTVVHGGRDLPETLEALAPGVHKTLIYKRNQAERSLHNTMVRSVGDVNADGIADMAVAAISESTYVFFGRRGLSGELDFEEEVATGGAVRLRHIANRQGDFAPLGDATGDGIDDFVMGIALDSVVFVEGRREWPEELDLLAAGSSYSRLTVIGASNVAAVGDTNGDGRVDVLVSGPSSSERKPVYLIYGAEPGALPLEDSLEGYVLRGGGVMFEWEDRPSANAVPMSVAGLGDLNGDGLAELLIGDEEGGLAYQGVTYLIHGREDFPGRVVFPSKLEALELEGVVRLVGERQSGRALGPAGDYNGDGYPDFTVGSLDLDLFPPGKIDLVFGAPDLPAELELGRLQHRGFQLTGLHRIANVTETARAPGDLNGDGAADFVFTEWRLPNWPVEEGEEPAPGSVHVVYGIPPSVEFVRGDADSDGELNLTDAVYTLSFLFLGGAFPICEDAADVDDLGVVELTDAVYLLNHLFLGGAPPPAPYPEAGEDPTDDALGCRGF